VGGGFEGRRPSSGADFLGGVGYLGGGAFAKFRVPVLTVRK